MDPYLEDPEHWRSFHHHLAEEIARQLNPPLAPKYFAEVEGLAAVEEIGISAMRRTYPDVAGVRTGAGVSAPDTAATIPEAPVQRVMALPGESKLRSVRIYTADTKELVTTIELLSPANKVGEGLQRYRRKREEILRSGVHLMEIDLLRSGERPGWELLEPPLEADYFVLVNRASGGMQRVSEIWPVALYDPLPVLPVPLRDDPDVALNLNAVVGVIYDGFYYALRIDYDRPVPPPPLRPDVEEWLHTLTYKDEE
jgi:hypothetical protein